MLYLIDGYNVTKGDPATRTMSLERQREALLARLRTRGAELLGPGRILVVFDGESGVGDSRVMTGSVEVRFARAGSADDAITRLAAAARENICLVTSDAVLRERVRSVSDGGVEMRGREVLFDAVQTRARRSRQGYPSRTVGLPKGANRITEELKGLWLDEGE